MTTVPTPYGSIPAPGATPPSDGWTYSLDVRGGVEDESAWLPPGTASVPLFPVAGCHPLGEVRLMSGQVEVRLVGARTARALPADTVELTVDEFRAMRRDDEYAATMRRWITG